MTKIQELLRKADRTAHYLHKKIGGNRTARMVDGRDEGDKSHRSG